MCTLLNRTTYLKNSLILIFVSILVLAPKLVAAGCATETILINNQYIGACGVTDTSSFTLDTATTITKIRIWYDTNIGGNTLSAVLSGPAGYTHSKTDIAKGACQWSWCEAIFPIDQTLDAGSYQIFANSSSICSDPSGKTTLMVYGCTPETVTNLSSDVAIDLNESSIADFYPTPELNPYFLTHSYDPMGGNENMFESCRVKVGDGGVRVENLFIDGVPYWVDLILNAKHPLLPLEIKNIQTGKLPDYIPEWSTKISGVDFTLASADVFGPPLQVTFFNVGIGDKAYDIDFVLDNKTGLFPFKGLREVGYLHYIDFPNNSWLGAVTKNKFPPGPNYPVGLSMSNIDYGDRIGFKWTYPDSNDFLLIEYGDRTIEQPFTAYYGVALGHYVHPYGLSESFLNFNLSAKAGNSSFWGRRLTTAEILEQCITHQTFVMVGLKAENQLQSALYDLAFATIKQLKIYDSNGEETLKAVKSFITDSKDSLAELMANGKVNPETLTVLIGTSIVKNATPEQHKKIIESVWGNKVPDHIKTLSKTSGNVVEQQYKEALLAFTQGAVTTLFPILSNSAKTIIQAQKWAIDVMGDLEIQNAYHAFSEEYQGNWNDFNAISTRINPNVRIKIKNILRNQGKSDTDSNVDDYLKATFNKWYQQKTEEMPKTKAALTLLKDEYLKNYTDLNNAMTRLLGANATECEKFAKFNELVGKFTLDLQGSLGKCKHGKPSANDIKNQAIFLVKNYFVSQSDVTNRANYAKNKLAFLTARDCLNYEDKTQPTTPSSGIGLTDPQKTDFLNCACRCSSGWAGHIGVWYAPNPADTTENGGSGACIGGAGSFGGTSRHPLVFNECTKSCWPSAAGNYNSSLVEQFLKQENDTFTSKATTK